MTNLITNGSMEDGNSGNSFLQSTTPTSWFATVGSVDMNRSNTQSPGLAPGTASSPDGGDYVWINGNEAFAQTLAGGALPVGSYTFEIEVWPENGHRGFFELRDQSGNLLQTVNVVSNETWQTVSVTFVSDGTVTGIEIDNNFSDGASGFVAFDGASLMAICFVFGTSIKTQSGEVAIEDLSAGDMVLTMDHGYQPIRWIGSTKRPATGDLAPILIRKGALGNDRDLRVSPQHRMLLQGWQAELLFGETEVLATAKSLVNDHSIIRVEGGEVEYFHILFDTHEIVWANGAPSESFHPGEQGWKALDEPTRDEIITLFPDLADGDFTNYGPSARISLKHNEGQILGHHMVKLTKEDLNA